MKQQVVIRSIMDNRVPVTNETVLQNNMIEVLSKAALDSMRETKDGDVGTSRVVHYVKWVRNQH